MTLDDRQFSRLSGYNESNDVLSFVSEGEKLQHNNSGEKIKDSISLKVNKKQHL